MSLCEHSFPVQPPHGSLGNPGPCNHCGLPYLVAMSLREIEDAQRELATYVSRLHEKHDSEGDWRTCMLSPCQSVAAALPAPQSGQEVEAPAAAIKWTKTADGRWITWEYGRVWALHKRLVSADSADKSGWYLGKADPEIAVGEFVGTRIGLAKTTAAALITKAVAA